VLVARLNSPAVLGEYALLRVLPWLLGVVISCGLPTASAFFMAGEYAADRHLRPTLSLMAVAGGGLAALTWLACAIPLHSLFFRQMPAGLVLLVAVPVVTSLWSVTAKGCCQGSGDIAGANLLIVAEELWFIPSYLGTLLLFGNRGARSVVAALIASGALYTATALLRLWRRRFFLEWGLPSLRLARKIAAFGSRGQLGNMLWLMNLRFDFVLLGALAGPAVLGMYAIASKFAELMRLVPTAVNYVLYPRFARLGRAQAGAEARRLLPRAAALTLVLTPVVALITVVGLPLVYGHSYHGAVAPAEIIITGLSIEGAAAVASAFLLGGGRPGLNSVGMGVGAVITVTLDVLLIPRYGAIGGAVTSAITYAATTMVLTFLARRLSRTPAPPGVDTSMRRVIDVVVAGVALAILFPLLLAVAFAVKLTSRGPVLYRQVRAGRSGALFTMLKFRSMVTGADRSGPLVTSRADPRVTRVGALLRSTKLDEVPQLINVLRGEMTIVGPRPEVPRFISSYTEDELAILRVRPGLTGPGQIFYTSVQEVASEAGTDPEMYYVQVQLHPKLAIDLDYLRRRGLRCDMGVVMQTVLVMVRRLKPEPSAVPAPAADRL
jgi:lipopolysaccharide/colanic/teichoic acid biosynthesis glycosyltransferase